MKLSYEYNEYLIGYVVTDEETNRSVNFQFHPVESNHPYPQWKLKFGCIGDDTYKDFTEEELEMCRKFISTRADATHTCSVITSIMHGDEEGGTKEKMRKLLEENGFVTMSDLAELYNYDYQSQDE